MRVRLFDRHLMRELVAVGDGELGKPSSFNRSKNVASSATVRSWKKGDSRAMVVMLASSARMR